MPNAMPNQIVLEGGGPDPALDAMSSAKTTAKRIGSGPVQKFRLWRLTIKRGIGGEDCGPYFQFSELPVSERHHGGIGYRRQSLGGGRYREIYEPTFWTQNGWSTEEQLPPEWKEINARAEAKAAEIERQFAQTNPTNAVLQDLTKAIKELALQKGAGHGGADGVGAGAGAAAGADQQGAGAAGGAPGQRGPRGGARGGA